MIIALSPGNATRTFDVQAQTFTFTGRRFNLMLADGKAIVFDVGKLVIDLASDEEVFKAGPGGGKENVETVCSVLA